MKVLFFTPTLLVSAIGRVSNLVVTQLIQQGHEVVVVRTEDIPFFESPTYLFPCEMLLWNNTEIINQLSQKFELVVYQIGDNYQYHRGCMEWLPSLPGLVSMHDNFLGHLFWSWSERIGRPQSLELLSNLYGTDIALQFFNHADSTSFIEYANEFAPMTEWIASMATSVIVHSSWAMNRITRACLGPVEVLPLPYDAPFLDTVKKIIPSKNSKQIVALTIGHVNLNKRYVSVIKAIGASTVLRQRMVFRIVGSVEPAMAKELTSLAGRLNVTITITGAVDDHQLATEIHNADVMCCLRWPALEAASASTIEAMLYGKAILVTNTGFYRELPDDCVLKISPEAELADLQTALERLVASPSERKLLGDLALNYATKTFRADNYVEGIINMKQRVNRSKIVSSAAQVFSNTLKRWGASGDFAIIAPIAAPLDLFS